MSDNLLQARTITQSTKRATSRIAPSVLFPAHHSLDYKGIREGIYALVFGTCQTCS